MSGALFLSHGSRKAKVSHDLPSWYRPRHKGGVDVSTGLYVREDEDLVLRRTPPFLFTRTYLAGDHVSRQLGVGTTNNAEWYVIGDSARFQWAELILANGGRIHFDRTSSGTSYANAMFLHRATPTAFYGARLGWTGTVWTMRLSDGTVATFQACSPGGSNVCSLIELLDADGHHLQFRRDRSGRLTAIEAPSERMTFSYDTRNRVVAAQVDGGARVDYSYDDRGRLTLVRASDGATREYTYGPHDEMLAIREPGWLIENTYNDDVRVIRQVTQLDPTPDDPHPEDAIIAFAYTVSGGAVTETDVTEYDGTHTVQRFNARHYIDVEIRDARGSNPILLSVDRDPAGEFVTGLTVRCMVNGRRVTRTEPVRGGGEEAAKAKLVRETCSPAGGVQ
jgi:YD repeat-containing protein